MKKDILYLRYHTLAPQMQETKCNRSYRTLKIKKNRYKKVKSSMPGCQGQLRVLDLLKICDTDLSWKQLLLKFANVGISCLNNGLRRH